jgi:DNA-binding winged helix-turn-helix (wHTH) protein/tetratricopeptide (TPR) repeat protein
MLKLADLAQRVDFRLGPLLVSPSRRHVEGPAGQAHVEPLVMQAFLLLLHALGKVVTRNELFDQCWGGATVGDDSLNRAIAGVRRIAAEVAPGLFEIETIPRTGYRLTGEILSFEQEAPLSSAGGGRTSRRLLLAGGATAVGAAGFGAWWLGRDRVDPRFEALIERGKAALRLDEPGAAKYFEQAVAIEPRNAKARGLLAYALANNINDGPGEVPGPVANAAERAARAALEIDPNEPNALLAMIGMQSGVLDWISREAGYRRVLAIDPNNTRAMGSLGQMLHGFGRCRESLAITERAIAIEPLAPNNQFRSAMQLWTVGQITHADRVINRAMNLWPSRRLVRMARLMIYAFTGRARAALAIVEEEQANPQLLSAAGVSMWRVSLEALESRSATAIEVARHANLEAARATPALAAYGILIMSALGELDAAFAIADGFLLGRGSVIVRPRPETRVPAVNGPGWRNTFGLFTPPTKAMRLDPRFGPLCDGLGLTEYWRKRGIGPDAFLMQA